LFSTVEHSARAASWAKLIWWEWSALHSGCRRRVVSVRFRWRLRALRIKRGASLLLPSWEVVRLGISSLNEFHFVADDFIEGGGSLLRRIHQKLASLIETPDAPAELRHQ
jgi:hypothetical protein